jgi:hypothetical protein
MAVFFVPAWSELVWCQEKKNRRRQGKKGLESDIENRQFVCETVFHRPSMISFILFWTTMFFVGKAHGSRTSVGGAFSAGGGREHGASDREFDASDQHGRTLPVASAPGRDAQGDGMCFSSFTTTTDVRTGRKE